MSFGDFSIAEKQGKSNEVIDPVPDLCTNRSQDIRKKSIMIRTVTAFSCKNNLGGIIFKDIECDMTNNSHVFDGMLFSDSTVIFPKCNHCNATGSKAKGFRITTQNKKKSRICVMKGNPLKTANSAQKPFV